MSHDEFRKAEGLCDQAEQMTESDPTGALILYARSIFLAPEHWKWFYCRANTYIQIGDLSSAMLNSKKAHYLNRGEKKIREQLCLLYDMDGLRDFHNRHIELALEKFNMCMRYLNPYPPALLHRGTVKLFFKKSQEYEGLKDLEQCRDTCIPYVNVIIGQFYLGRDELRKASSELEVCRKEHQYVKEVMAFQQKFDSVIKDKKIHLRKKVAQRKFEQALELASELIFLCSSDMELYFLRAVILRARENYAEAIKDFILCKNKKFEKETSKALLGKCMYSIAEQYYGQKRYIDCINYMDEGIVWQNSDEKEIRKSGKYVSDTENRRRTKDRVRNYVLRGDAYLQLHKYELAIGDYRKAHKLEQNEVTNQRLSQLHLRWGKIFLRNGKLKLGEDMFTKAIDFLKDDCEAYLYRGKTRFAMERVQEAVEDLVAFYLMNNRNESVNKLVYQYIPQIVYSTKIQRHYRKKFGLSLKGIGTKLELSNPNVRFSPNRIKSSDVDINILGGRKSPPPPRLSYQEDRTRAKSAPTYQYNRRSAFSSDDGIPHGKRDKRKRRSGLHVEKPLLEFGGEEGIRFPEIYSTSMKREQERNLDPGGMGRDGQGGSYGFWSKKTIGGGAGSGLSYQQLRKMTRLKKKQEYIHNERLKRIRDSAVFQPSSLNSPVRRIKDRESKVWGITPQSSRTSRTTKTPKNSVSKNNRSLSARVGRRIQYYEFGSSGNFTKKKREEEDDDDDEDMDLRNQGRTKGSQNMNYSVREEVFPNWIKNQKKQLARFPRRVPLGEIGKKNRKKKRKKRIDPLKLVY